MKIRMKFFKSTKNTHVFHECNSDGSKRESFECAIPSLYIRKSAIKQPAQFITVTVNVESNV